MVTFETMEFTWTWQLAGSLVYLAIASSLIAIGLLLAMIPFLLLAGNALLWLVRQNRRANSAV